MAYLEEAQKRIEKEKEERAGKLDLSLLQLNQIPSEVAGMDWLRTLGLYGNKIQDISLLKNLIGLNYLNLGGNRIEDYSFLENLTSLTSLYLSDNRISDIRFLEKLMGLTFLDLSSNRIVDYSFLGSLANLTSLDLSSNKIVDYSFLGSLANLTSLELRYNRITDLRFLEKHVGLTSLDLSDNKIENISPLLKLTKLNKVTLNNNEITDLTELWTFLNKKGLKVVWKETHNTQPGEVNLKGNPLITPPVGVVRQGHKAVQRYFEELERSGAHQLMESRLLIVGQGGAGKTSLKTKLKNTQDPMPKAGDTTRGIEIEPLTLKTPAGEDFTLHVWDFGGQNIQHYAHQFFLSGSSLYVLVHNQREQNTNFQYWLNIIEMLGQSSPVIILQNEVAGYCDPLDNAGSIRDRFQNVQEPFHIVNLWDAATDARFEILKRTITTIASNPQYLPHFGTTRPVSYVKVQEKLAAYPMEQQFITWKEFEALCAAEGVVDIDLVRDYSKTFTVLGKCLHFPDDIELRNFVFLRPKWIIDALFSLLYHDIVIDQKGQFDEMDTAEIWQGQAYEAMHGKLIRLMENFELCYPVEGYTRRRFIVPQRLPAAGTAFPWEEHDTVRVVYRYKFMPKGVITRLICRLHRQIEGSHVWSDAVIFAKANVGRIFVRERYAEEEIWIEAAGKKRSDLLNRVVEVIDEIHAAPGFVNLKVSKLLPCNCSRCQRADEPYYFDYDYLVGLLGKNRKYADCQKSYEEIEIRSFLARIFENGDEKPAYLLELREVKKIMLERFDRNEELHETTHGELKAIKQALREAQDLIESSQTEILQKIDRQPTDDTILQGYLDEIMGKLDQLTEKQQETPNYQELKKALKTDADVKGKFKFTWTLLPKILTDLTGLPNIAYEKEIAWDLKAVAQQIIQDFKEGKVFLK